MIQENNVSGIEKHACILEYNDWFCNQEWYSKHPRNLFKLDVEENRRSDDWIFDEVLHFCLSTDVCKQLGMSFADFMQLDLYTFTKVKDAVMEQIKKRNKAAEQYQEEAQNKQDKLLGALNANRPNKR